MCSKKSFLKCILVSFNSLEIVVFAALLIMRSSGTASEFRFRLSEPVFFVVALFLIAFLAVTLVPLIKEYYFGSLAYAHTLASLLLINFILHSARGKVLENFHLLIFLGIIVYCAYNYAFEIEKRKRREVVTIVMPVNNI